MSDLAERLGSVSSDIADALREAGRDADSLTTIVVTKFHPASIVRELVSLGVSNFGESRHQEAQPKIAELSDLDATWHFVGQVQSKKAKLVRDYVDVVHSVDRASIVDALAGEPLDVFLQVNLTPDPNRGGVQPAELLGLADQVAAAPGLHLLGLMAVAPLDSEPRRGFALLAELSEQLQTSHPASSALSMGMSGDFREAILEGATHLRIGTAITGNRPNLG